MEIEEQYQKMYEKAKKIAEDDIAKYPLQKKNIYDSLRSRMEKHLIGMIEMYCVANPNITEDDIKQFNKKVGIE